MYQRVVQLNLPKSQSIDIEFTDLRYDVNVGYRGEKKTILKGVNGLFKSGELTAIMGPSGAGKSTLLNMLTGFQKRGLKGTINYVSNHGKQTFKEYRKQSCYIQQDDRLYPLFTVNETMLTSADLKLGNSLNSKAKQMLIDDILDTLDLMKAKDTRCDRLSGGQRKRLSVALELVDNPPVMFLDEPTTGLDSSASLQCVTMLQSLARGGRTIVCTIHQPSAAIYELFDHVYLLADGLCMYEGAPKNTVAYFASVGLNCPKYHNPADYMIEVVSKEYGNFSDQLNAMSRDKEYSWRNVIEVKSSMFTSDMVQPYRDEEKTTILIAAPSEFTKFWTLVNRCFLLIYRDWTLTHLRFVIHVLVGALLGLVFEDAGSDGSKTINNVGFLLITVVYLCYTSMMPALLKFPSALAVLRKERFNNWYQLRTYYIAILLVNLPVQMIGASIYSCISYFLSSQPLDWNRFLMFLVIVILTAFIGESYGLLLGTLVNPINGTFLGAIIICALLSMAGFLVLFNHMPIILYYASYASYLRYSLDGLVQAMYGYGREKLPCPNHEIYCHYRVPQTILEELSMTEEKYWLDIVVLVLNFFLFQFIGYFTLKRKLSIA